MYMEEFIEFLKERRFSPEEMELLVLPFGFLEKEDRKAFLEECRSNPDLLYEMKRVLEKQREEIKNPKNNDIFKDIEEGAEKLVALMQKA